MIKHRGLRHLALNVSDVERAVAFYSRVFGLRLVWQPDPDNAYLSSGCDNLALHKSASDSPSLKGGGQGSGQALDHLGFIVPTIAEVEAAWEWAQAEHLDIAHAFKRHRDGSVSFYIRDPDANVIQVLYEPTISPQTIT